MSDPRLEGQDEQLAHPVVAEDGAPARTGLHRTGLLRQWPIALVLLGVVISLLVVTSGHFRRGSVLLAGTVVLAMFLRLLLRDDEAGMLAVRSKVVDVATLAVLGIGLAVLAFAVPAPA